MVKNLLIKGNTKMGPEVFLFNLPARETCTPTRWCLGGKNGNPGCYALKGNFQFPSVQKATMERLKHSQEKDFVGRMIVEITRKEPKYFRFHSSGDFYSSEYVKKVRAIAEACPETLFRTTTRRRDFIQEILRLNALPNFIVRESLDDERPIPEMGLPFAALAHLPVVGEQESYHCKNSCPECEYHCWENSVNIDFDMH
jgi:hypothetical protein